ncbi:MAG: hypothetical protein HKP14_06530 [Bacteroidia bacterium]|nr:hypothetical protein [Bacteroidia bacterium]
MSRDSVHQKIDDLLGLLSINNNRLSLHSEKLSRLDLDVLRKQCIELYEQINQLALSGKITSTPTPPVQKKPAPKTATVVEQVPKKEKEEATTITNVREASKTNAPQKTKKQEEAEMLSLFEKFSSKPIASIPKAISVAKRFEFQSNFFDGDAKAYKEFMSKLDNAENREAAFKIYHEYKVERLWDNEELKDELKALMYRKHS